MGSYQVLFSGEVAPETSTDVVRANLARTLGIDERKARALFSGRTVVLRSQLDQPEALALQEKLAELGALVRIKNFAPQPAKYKGDGNQSDYTLRDITAAHLECPRCGHLQLDSSHCARCGVDLQLALKQQRKEDMIIEKKIRQLRGASAPIATPEPSDEEAVESAEDSAQDDARPGFKRVVSWLTRTR